MKRFAFFFAAAMPGACCGVMASTLVAASDSSQVLNLDEVEVVATRATAKTPMAFSMVSARELDEQNDGRTVPFLLQSTPSVLVTSDDGLGVGYSSIRVRGTDASRINVTSNGIPVNDAESHNVYWVNIPDVASSLQDVQIQRGAGTSTNGAGAFGASINMTTSTPHLAPYATVDGAYGMYGTHRETLRLGTGLLGGHWVVDGRISNIGTDGYIDRAWGQMWSYFGQVAYYHDNTSLKLLAYGGKERTYMAWDYASKEEMAEYGRRYNPCGRYTDSDGNTAYYPNQYDNYRQHNFQLIFNHRFNANWHLNLALHYTKGDGYYEQYKTRRTLVEYGLEPFIVDGAEVKKADLIRLKNMDNGFGGGIFSLTYDRGPLSAILGGGVNNYRGHHFGQVAWVRNYVGALDPLQEYYRNRANKTDANIYARANVDIWKGLSGYVDLQYRHVAYSITGVSDTYDWNIGAMQQLDIDRHFNFFNPKVGLNFKISDAHRVFASWSVAHREPVRDNFLDCAPDRLPVAERLFDYELGYSFTHSDLFSAGVNLYFMDYKDQLVPTGQLSDTGNPVSVNVPDSYRMGVELEWTLRPAKWFNWQFTTTLSRNRIKNFVEYIYEDEWTNPITIDCGDTPIAFSPDFTFHNAFNFDWRGFDASLRSQYVSRQYLTNSGNAEQVLDPYFVTDLHLGYTFRNIPSVKELRLGFTVYNLFAERYESNGYAGAGYYVDDQGSKVIYRYAGYAAQAPCHVMGTVTVKF